MNNTEAVALCRLVAAHCPAQHFDEYTPDAWYDVLSDITFEDARSAVNQLARQQTFIAPNEVRQVVMAIRRDRIERGRGYLAPPKWLDDMPDGPEQAIAYRDWIQQAERDLADGREPESATPIPGIGAPDELRRQFPHIIAAIEQVQRQERDGQAEAS